MSNFEAQRESIQREREAAEKVDRIEIPLMAIIGDSDRTDLLPQIIKTLLDAQAQTLLESLPQDVCSVTVGNLTFKRPVEIIEKIQEGNRKTWSKDQIVAYRNSLAVGNRFVPEKNFKI